jgi:hypothetical protein
MTYRGPDWEMHSDYWFKLANKTMRCPLWPRECSLTGRTLWLKPAVRGRTSYHTRSGSFRQDIRWADPMALTELGLRGQL